MTLSWIFTSLDRPPPSILPPAASSSAVLTMVHPERGEGCGEPRKVCRNHWTVSQTSCFITSPSEFFRGHPFHSPVSRRKSQITPVASLDPKASLPSLVQRPADLCPWRSCPPTPPSQWRGPGQKHSRMHPQLWAGFSSDKRGGAAAQKPALQGAGHFSF